MLKLMILATTFSRNLFQIFLVCYLRTYAYYLCTLRNSGRFQTVFLKIISGKSADK